MSNEIPKNGEENDVPGEANKTIIHVVPVVEAPITSTNSATSSTTSSASPNGSTPARRKSRNQLPPSPPISPSSNLVHRKNKNLNTSRINVNINANVNTSDNHEQSLPLILGSPTDTVQTGDTCPLDLSLGMEEEEEDEYNHGHGHGHGVHGHGVHVIHNLDEEEQNLGACGTPALDCSPVRRRRRAILTTGRFQHWKDHSHAVGLAPVSWLEERQEEYELMVMRARSRSRARTNASTRTDNASARTDNANATATATATNDTAQDAQDTSYSSCYNWKEIMQFYGSHPSLFFCTRFQRVGNMVILMECKDWMQLSTRDDYAVPIDPLLEEGNTSTNANANGNTIEAASTSPSSPSRRFTTTETRYTMVLGPYWSTLFCFTLPLITTLSTITATNAIFIPANLKSSEPSGCWIIATWTTSTLLLYLSLLYTSLVDPGILPRYKERPRSLPLPLPSNSESNSTSMSNSTNSISNSGNWRWNDQAQSYIPPDAVYEPDCKVVIEGYHHTCVYTGTAIGKNNIWSFWVFVVLGFACLFMDVVLLSIMM